MSKEVERKFWVKEAPKFIFELPSSTIVQGYLSIDPNGKEIRLRQKDDSYFLTIKSQGTLERQEFETELSKNQFEVLWPAVGKQKIIKRRYFLSQENSLIEIDIYDQPLNGLIVAEIEFQSVEAANAYIPEPWMIQEITALNFMKNKNLLQFDTFDQLKQLL